MENSTLFSVLLVAIGLLVGFIIAFMINNMKVTKASKEAEKIINQAKKDAEKIKSVKDAVLYVEEKLK